MDRRLGLFLYCLLFSAASSFTPSAQAVTGWCAAGSDTSTPGQGTPHQYPFSANTTVTDVTDVDPGKTIHQDWNENGKYTAWCDNTPGVKSVTYFKAEMGDGLLGNKVSGGEDYYYIPNTFDILSVQTHIELADHPSPILVPFTDIANSSPDDHSKPKSSWYSGGRGYITLRVEKAITTSRIVIPPTVVAQMWGSHVKSSYGPSPLVQIIVAGTIVVPQSCTINGGTLVRIDLGSAWAGDFDSPGVKPNDYTPVTTTIKAHCDNTVASEQLSLGIEAPVAEGGYGAIKTNKSDVGIMLSAQSAQSQEILLRSDTPATRLPFQLDADNGEASITLKAWPVRITNEDLTPGNYAGIAVLDIYTP